MEPRNSLKLVYLLFVLFLVSVQCDQKLQDMIWKVFSSPNSLSSTENVSSKETCEEKCYPEIGCFPPVTDCLRVTYGNCNQPQALEDINTAFMFFSKKNQYNPFLVNFTLSENEIKKVPFNPQLITVVLVHGYEDKYSENLTLGPQKNLYLNKMNDANIIAVDWSKGAANPNYAIAKANAKVVGAQIALVLEKLNKVFGVNLDTVMIIGFSLGGQLVSHAGTFTEQRFNKKVSRIIGLDAAGICYDDRIFWKPDAERLSPARASLVEALHTNSAPLGYGHRGREAHYDYYPNGGDHQPGCVTLSVILALGFERSYCSHMKKQDYYGIDYEAFGECQPVAYNCSDYNNFLKGYCASCEKNQCQLMALGIQVSKHELTPKVPKSTNLKLYLKTTNASPFCMFHFQVKAAVKKGYEPKSIELKLSDGNESEIVSLTSGPSGYYYGLLTIPETTAQPAVGPFKSAVIRDVFVDGNSSVNIIEKLEVNYMSNINDSDRKAKSTVLCPTSASSLVLCASSYMS